MKRIYTALLILGAIIVCAPCSVQAQDAAGGEVFRQEGIASWYGSEFDGRPTASGEIFNSSLYTAAHPNLPFGTILTVTNKHNNKTVTVKVNDRGPFVSARIIDLSRAAAQELDMLTTGTAPVLIETAGAVTSRTQSSAEADALWATPPDTQQQPASEPPPAAPAQAAATTEPQTAAPAQTAATTEPQTAAPAQTAATTEPQTATSTTQAPAATAEPKTAVPAQAAPVIVRRNPASLIPPVAPSPEKVYRLQVGSYRVARNAVDAFDKLKNAGLNPAYERYEDFFRVVLAGIPGSDVYSLLEKLGAAGFREALIREEHQ